LKDDLKSLGVPVPLTAKKLKGEIIGSALKDADEEVTILKDEVSKKEN